MTETPEAENGTTTQEVQVAWPIDTYVGGKTVNQFVFNIANGVVNFAFGHVPPVPSTPIPVPPQMAIPVVGAYVFEPSMLISLRNVLNSFAEAHPEYFESGDKE